MRCSAAALERHEPLAGTAPSATRFLMIEYPGSWPAEALDAFEEETRAALNAAASAVRGQVLLVRRPDIAMQKPEQIRTAAHRWWVVDLATRTQRDGSWTVEADLAGAAAALQTASPGDRPAELALLVCCHAKRDQCCAIDGRPLATLLAAQWPEATWQCTHLHGHRFAATFAILPDGVCYGRVPPHAGAQVVADQLDGRPTTEFLRGFFAQQPWEQAACADVLTTVASAVRQAPMVTSAEVEPGRWRCTVHLGGAPYARLVRGTRNPPSPLSCGSDAPPKPSMSYAVEEG